MPERRLVNVDVTTGSILRLIGLVVLLALLWTLRSVVAIVIFSFIFSSAIGPLVDRMHRRRVPRALGIALVFLVVLGVLAVIVFLFGQLVTDQAQQLATSLPGSLDRIIHYLFGSSGVDKDLLQTVQGWLETWSASLLRISGQVLAGTVGLFGGAFTFVGILVLTFYLTLEQDGLKRSLAAVSSVAFLPYLYQLVDRIQARLGGWLRGQLLLSLIIGAMSYVGLALLGVDYALSLALLAGLTEMVPIAGPIIGAIPAIIVAFGQAPLLALIVAALYIVIQQTENNFIVPKVMQKTTGLNPIVTIVAMLIGGTLFGFAGIVLAIPMTVVINAFFEDFFAEAQGSSRASDAPPVGDV